MRTTTIGAARGALFALIVLTQSGATAASGGAVVLDGRWDAAVTVNGVEIPFRFDIDDRTAAISGSFFNGDRPINSTRRFRRAST